MKPFYLFIFTIIICTSTFGQNIFELRNEISKQFLNAEKSAETITQIGKQLEKLSYNNKEDQIQLAAEYEQILKELNEHVPLDSLQKTYYDFYVDFSQMFINDFKQTVLATDKYKIILFATSVSCVCTIDMCVDQLADMLNTAFKYNVEFLVVDAFTDMDLTAKYDIGFYPTVIILNNNNAEVNRYTRETELTNKLDTFFKL